MTKDTYCVYILTFPNGKHYVGMCKEPAENRWQNGWGYYGQRLMINAIKKYGWENVERRIPYSGVTKEVACEKEIELIKELNSNYLKGKNGYNLSDGGESGFHGGKHSTETKELLSELNTGANNAFYGKKHSTETKLKMSRSGKGKHYPSEETREKMRIAKAGENHPMYGKHRSEEVKQKLRDANLGENNPIYGLKGRDCPHSKLYRCIETGKVYKSLSEVKEALNANDVSHISAVCRGKRKTANGHRWEYVTK
jgi:hypothetical protein